MSAQKDGKPLAIRELSSPNCGERKDGLKPAYLILHYTGTATGREAEEGYYMNPSPPGGPVAPHYMIDVDGTITRFVPEDKSAWQAGRSRFDGVEDFNSRSIGIEIVNTGHEFGVKGGKCAPFPKMQMEAVAALCLDIMARNGIPPKNVLGHSDIAPGRKVDPGEAFDWPWLAARGIGVWPQPGPDNYRESAHWPRDENALRRAFGDAGMDDRVDTGTLLKAFHSHYFPENIDAEAAGAETAARLHRLIQLRHS